MNQTLPGPDLEHMTPRKPKPDDPEQYRRFVEVAKELGVNENDSDAMDRAFERVQRGLKTPTVRKSASKGRLATR